MTIMKGGIVNPATWNEDKQKGICRQVLVILKEAPAGEHFQLLKHLNEGGRGNTYNNVAMWLFLLRHFRRDNTDISFKEALKKKTKKGRWGNLIHAAVININDHWLKSAKGKRTKDSMLYENHTAERQAEIESFISETAPEVILCGGKVVVECLRKYGTLTKFEKDDTLLVKAYRYTVNGKDFLLISMPHPNAPIKQALAYKSLMNLIEKIQIK